MSDTTMDMKETQKKDEHNDLDVLVIGAGVSGLGMAYNLKKNRPHDRFAIIEARKDIGGTWDLFKYPGIRSDSDMYTFAYSFKPWTKKEFIGEGGLIVDYLKELVDEARLEEMIRFEQRVERARWCSDSARWHLTVRRADGSQYEIRTRFVVTCTGYYNYEKGYVPEFEGYDDFKGVIAHPQHWPTDLDYQDKNVVVIGSGATAITVVPSMAEKARHVTMLQRSPTYIASSPSEDFLFKLLSRLMPSGLTNRIMRLKYLFIQQLVVVFSQYFPNAVRKLIRHQNRKALQGSADVDTHFSPKYKPWEQRMCMVPNDDLFDAIKAGKAGVVTDHIERFTETGIKLKSGDSLEADIIVPATGLDIQFWGGMDVEIDGHKVEAKNLTNYKGMMFSQVPNFVTVFGYTKGSWTLKAELTYDYVCRLLDHMQDRGHDVVYPYLQKDIPREDLVDLQSGYVMRAKDKIPLQGAEFPWRNKDLYIKDIFAIKHSKLVDEVLHFDDTEPLATFHASASEVN